VNSGFSNFENLSLNTLNLWPSRQKLLESELGILTIGDLLNHLPNRFVDKSQVHKIKDVGVDSGNVQLVGRLESLELLGQKRAQRLKGVFSDGSGYIELVWFKSIPWIRKALEIGKSYRVFGKLSEFKGVYSISHPEIQALDSSKEPELKGFEPIYPLTEKLKAARIDSKIIYDAIHQVFKHPNFSLPEFIPNYILTKLNLTNREEAYRLAHFPTQLSQSQTALNRFKFEEMFLFQLRSERTRINRRNNNPGPIIQKTGYFFNEFYSKHLPFELTEAQKRVIKEIWNDMKSGIQMNRLLQGDVGSGKTIVAFIVMLLAIDNGFQTSIMAPTEILAHQHFESLQEWATPIGLRVGFLTGSSTKKEREELHQDLIEGKINLLVGTHALLEDNVVFKNLGLVIIDEQHRFGVAQRSKLWLKAKPSPHMLVMTATPIPRTLAMTAHGESDHSIINMLPKGRKTIRTIHKSEYYRVEIMTFVKSEIEKGRQIYFVFPLIEESEQLDYNNLMDGFDTVADFFPAPQYRMAIVHGKMRAEDKEKEMERFKSGKAHILVATTVIEVGVNVPNASVMVIESAERFGLSQLHQLRGRVGRGAEQSYCILMTKERLNPTAKERMEAMVNHSDGFEIANIDLKQRGPGDILGTKQSGLPDFKFVDLVKDEAFIKLARHAAKYVFGNDPNLELPENKSLKNYLLQHNHDNFWSKIS
jgi:ATP-dependent DNA helicase RecG